jgi:hypothetical protein
MKNNMKMNLNIIKTEKRARWVLLLFTIILLWISSCANYERPGEEPIQDVSFSEDLIPFFETSCAYAGCHNTGGIPPDLTEDFAYASLTNGGYIDTDNPEQSLLYTKISEGGSMERYSTPRDTQMVLQWIIEGAENN